MRARYELHLESYEKTINIEAKTLIEMAEKDIMPAVSSFIKNLSDTYLSKKSAGVGSVKYEKALIEKLSALNDQMYADVTALEAELAGASEYAEDLQKLAEYYKDVIIDRMEKIRKSSDAMEVLTERKYWPYPSYADLLFGVR